jgi:Xaa-Pro aminopeptidase
MTSRVRRLRRLLERSGVDSLLVTDLSNVRYLCGYSGSNGAVLVTPNTSWFYTDFRYQEQVKTEVKGCRVRTISRGLFTDFPVEHTRSIRRLGVESANLTLAVHRLLKRRLKGVRLVPLKTDLVLELRRCKDAAEVKAIEAAQRVTDRVFNDILGIIRPGISERELAAEITYRFSLRGENAFRPIVASGPNGAKPHAGSSDRKLRNGDAVTFDIGCQRNGYCSDMTRTVFVGRIDPDLRQVYDIVLEAQLRGLAAVRHGVACRDADEAARGFIRDAGYGPYFGHGLGHGVGIDVHEVPAVAHTSKQTLTAGDVVTVEPGIYLPGFGGVRIEDMVLVTRDGYRNFTRSPKKLIQL